MSAQVRARLTALLAIEEVLGAAAIDAAGEVEYCINLVERDAAALYRVLALAVGNFGGVGQGAIREAAGCAPSFATFSLREGQIAYSGTHHRSLIVLTDPGIEVRSLKALLHEVLDELAVADYQPESPPVPVA